MSALFPLTGHVRAPWYPGASLPLPGSTMEEPLRLFDEADDDRFWLLEGHWSRGMTPLCFSAANDVLWGTQYGANMYQLPVSKGQAARVSGAHIYVSDLPCCSPWEVAQRAGRVDSLVGPAISNFSTLWPTRRDAIIAALEHFEGADVPAMDLAELNTYLREAWAFHRWVWEVHFELMDPLIGNYFAFKGTCAELGIAETDIVRFLQGSDTKIMETDRALWRLAAQARSTPVEDVLAAEPATNALRVLGASTDPIVVSWLAALNDFLREFGWRTEGMCDPALAPWIEDPTPVMALLSTFLRREAHDFDAARRLAVADRDAAVATTMEALDETGRSTFESALTACRSADFSWWQEEHNFYIDLRAHIPIRRAALRLGELLGVDTRDDLLFVFRHELDDLAAGRARLGDIGELIPARRAFYDASRAERGAMPPVLGTPSTTDDPVMSEIFGVDQRMMASVASVTAETVELHGVPASGGVVTGVARVVLDASQLDALQVDEILVCGFTSPNWTPAFALIAGCVADTGGVLSHTAIVSREYRIPAVCATGAATTLIRTGDLIEVDGTAGIVRIVERAG